MPDIDVDTGAVTNKLRDLSVPGRQRVADQLAALQSRTQRYLDDTGVSRPIGKTVTLVKRTGADGKRALDALSNGYRRAADGLLRLSDKVRTQRAFVGAWARGEASTKELATALRRYDDLDAAGEAVAEDLVAATGDDGIELIAKADGSTVRTLADGSGDLDQSFRRAVARAADGDSLDSFEQIDRAVRKIDKLDSTQQRRAKQLIVDADGAGVKLIDEIDTNKLRGTV